MERWLLFLILGCCATPTMFGEAKISPDLPLGRRSDVVDVIVQFQTPVTAAHHQKVIDRGGQLKQALEVVRGGLYSMPAGMLEDLAQDPEVYYISPDRTVRGMLDYANPTINANIALQYGFDGTGVGVAVIDSGIVPILDLMQTGGKTSRIVYNQSFVSGTTSTYDDYGHGTHVAGIVAGNAAYSSGAGYTHTFRGIAPKANLINLRVLDASGSGTDSAVIAAIERAISLKDQYNIRVINLSLGRPVFESYTKDPLCQAVEQAWAAGIVVVAAAGNSGRDDSQGTQGYGTISAPGNDPAVITVGAMKDMGTVTRGDDLIASYSSKGPTLIDHIVKPDIVAPGNRIISLQATKSTLETKSSVNFIMNSYYEMSGSKSYSGIYYRLSGTSMAAPMVSGAAALLLQKTPSLTPDVVKARLMKTATKSFPSYSVAIDPVTGNSYQSQYDIFTIGAGYLDAWAALNSTDLLPNGTGSAISPTATFDSASGIVHVGNTANSGVWGNSAAWGMNVVWGSSVFAGGGSAVWGTNVVWGANVVWGSSGTQGFNVVWGGNAVWGSTTNESSEGLNQLINGEN
jgi:serine protease AprX